MKQPKIKLTVADEWTVAEKIPLRRFFVIEGWPHDLYYRSEDGSCIRIMSEFSEPGELVRNYRGLRAKMVTVHEVRVTVTEVPPRIGRVICVEG